MRFNIKNPGSSIVTLLRKVGYYNLRDSFIRPLARSGYPRFHLYITQEEDNFVFDLHLDQKKPVYKEVSAHSGEYNSDIVKKEAERIKETLT